LRLLESDQRLRALSRQLLNVQEAERRDIARELHDEIGQSLTAVRIHLEAMIRTSPAEDPCVGTARDCVGIVEQTLRQVRNLCLDLRPPQLDDLGLVAAVRWQLDRQTRAAGLEGYLSASGIDAGLDQNLATVCFRVVQEALTNVVRHAGARNVWVDLRQKGDVLGVLVRDDGRGFDVAGARARAVQGGSVGLLSMQERAMLAGGRLTLSSIPGNGTEVRAEFPLKRGGAVGVMNAMEVRL
jgi:signal transduction histidine kinase